MDAAESRARASLHLADEAANRVEELEEALARVRDGNTSVEIAKQAHIVDTATLLELIKGIPSHVEKPISVSPSAVTLRGRTWKVVIPFALVVTLTPLIWALVTTWLDMKQQFKVQKDTYAEIQKRADAQDQRISELTKSNNDLRENVARLAGYVAAVLPNAGVKVPGAEPGAIAVSVQADPLPRGSKRQTPVTTHTLVPAPKPR